MSSLPPEEDADHEDGRLMHDLAATNTKITRYLFHFMDADAGRVEPIGIDEERQLAEELTAVAEQLQARADRRAALRKSPTTIASKGGQPPALEPSQAPGMDNGP